MCARCSNDGVACVYSRYGIIRRRKRKRTSDEQTADTPSLLTPASLTSRPDIEPINDTSYTQNRNDEAQSHLTTDIEATRGLLHGLGASQYGSLSALSSLSKACAAVWHNEPGSDKSGQSFFLFEDRADSWADSESAVFSKSRAQR